MNLANVLSKGCSVLNMQMDLINNDGAHRTAFNRVDEYVARVRVLN